FRALGFRACSGFRFNFKLRLRLHCPASHAGAYSNLALLGQRCPAPHLFPSASLVFALPRPDLSDRVSLALGTGGGVNRRPGPGAGASIFDGCARTTRRAGLSRPPDALLAPSEQRVPAFSLRRRRGSLSAPHCRHSAHSLPRPAFRILSFAQHRGADVLQLSMGYPAARNGISGHLPRALALVAETRPACAGTTRR